MNRKDRRAQGVGSKKAETSGEDLATLLELAVRLQTEERQAEAIQTYKKILQIDPRNLPALNNLGLAYKAAGELAQAEACLQKGVMIAPDVPELQNAYGLLLVHGKGVYAQAEKHYRKAIALRPDYAEAHWNLGYLLLMKGDYKTGWAEFAWRWKMPDRQRPPVLTAPVWQGEPLSGKSILLHGEQGLGDSIQFVRYARFLKAQGARTILPCAPALARLFESVDGVDVVNREGEPIPTHDCCASLMDLPQFLTARVEDIPADPYLKADSALCAQWAARLADAGITGLKVGIVWRGNPTHVNDRNRSMRAGDFAGLLDLPGITAVILQKDARPDEVEALSRGRAAVYNPSAELGDFADTAGLIENLDLVIAVDTSVCHLAGGLGKPVWTLIPYVPDWRWLLEREDTPWYPSMRLFRQKKTGDWRGVLDRVRDALINDYSIN